MSNQTIEPFAWELLQPLLLFPLFLARFTKWVLMENFKKSCCCLFCLIFFFLIKLDALLKELYCCLIFSDLFNLLYQLFLFNRSIFKSGVKWFYITISIRK